MNDKKIFTILGTVVALTVLSPWLGRANSQDLQQRNLERLKITGTWRVLVDPQPNPAGDPAPFFVYTTFNREGTLIQSSSDALEGSRPGHGIWIRTAKNELQFAFEKFIEFNPITQQQGISVFRVEETINLTGENSYQGFAQVSLCNNAGQECQPIGTARTQGSRLELTK
jgi:hypothetical protein